MNPYEVLGVRPDASREEARRAYLALARRHHPDAGGDTDAMRRINAAWVALNEAPVPVDDVVRDDDVVPDDDIFSEPIECDPEVRPPLVVSARRRLLDDLTLVALLTCVVFAAGSFLFGMFLMSGPLLGFGVFMSFMACVMIVARTLLAMGSSRR